MDLPIATEAAALLADNARTAFSERLFHLVRNKLAGRTADIRALENLVQEPRNTRHQEVVAAALTDAIAEDPRFGDELRQAVSAARQADVHVPRPVRTFPDQSRAIRTRGAGILWPVTGVVVGLVLAGTITYLAIDDGEPDERPRASEVGGRRTGGNLVLPTNPYEAVRMVYHDIAQGAEERVCLRFTESARDEFAGDLGYRNCAEAVAGLEEQVTDKSEYAESMPSYKSEAITGNSVRISSCRDNIRGGIRGGPGLGVFTVEKIRDSRDGQWIISGHESETC